MGSASLPHSSNMGFSAHPRVLACLLSSLGQLGRLLLPWGTPDQHPRTEPSHETGDLGRAEKGWGGHSPRGLPTGLPSRGADVHVSETPWLHGAPHLVPGEKATPKMAGASRDRERARES